MASEYLKWKYRDVKPRERTELTASEKRKNWWYYHKWHVVIAAAVLAVTAHLFLRALGLGQIEPDYRVAYVGTNSLPDDTVSAIETGFAALGEDLNGDGRVIVELAQYPSTGGADAGMAYSAEILLMSDILECESYFFLLEDPEGFQRSYHSLCLLDGSLPEEGDSDPSAVCLSWGACPVLDAMELGEYAYDLLGKTVRGHSRELVSPLYLARRGFWTEKSAAYPEGCAALWDRLTEGAIP